MLGSSAHKNNSAKSFFLLKFQCHIYLILMGFNVSHYQGILSLFHFLLDHLDHRGKERVGNTPYKNCNALGVCSLKISCTVIGNISGFPDNLHYSLFGFGIYIRMIVDSS